jgi:2',3'-cyclic-nucleotide 2'-phosphodiesterase
MRVLFCGDVMGRSGRQVVLDHVPALRKRLALDLVVVNGENAASGHGITVKIAEELLANGVDVLTTGNHVWDQRELLTQIDSMPRVLRPANLPAGTPGRGASIVQTPAGKKVMVINIIARLFMDLYDNPFAAIERILAEYTLGKNVHAVIVDFHGEASSEKQAMGHFLDGRVSLVVGTHTHVPTADHRILPGGTAYQTDVGMCGDYDSVIGMGKDVATQRFLKKVPLPRLEPALGPATLCAILVDLDDATGLATRIEPVRIGGLLSQAVPA